MTKLVLENIVKEKLAEYEVPLAEGAWNNFESNSKLATSSSSLISGVALKVTIIASLFLIPAAGIYFLMDYGKVQKDKLLNRQHNIQQNEIIENEVSTTKVDSAIFDENVIFESKSKEDVEKELTYIFKPIDDGNIIYFGPAEANADDIKKFRMLIRNRKGKVIFESNSSRNLWNGKLKDKDRYASNGEYDWFIVIEKTNDEVYRKKGKVILER